MSLQFINWEIDGVTVLTLSGRLVLGNETTLFRSAIEELLEAGKPNILLDLHEVSHMDSSGIGELMAAHSACKRHGGALKLMNIGRRVETLLQMMSLYTVCEIVPNEEQGIRSFTPLPPLSATSSPQFV
ncbi:MAG TPA: STAS domain-containing protein [Bryobacteraceae bacterium]|nr:STAS domain-containing protein [Bryobacteraceae bacterium]